MGRFVAKGPNLTLSECERSACRHVVPNRCKLTAAATADRPCGQHPRQVTYKSSKPEYIELGMQLLILIFFGLSLAIPRKGPGDHLEFLTTIPVQRTTLIPRTYIKTRYAALAEKTVVSAHMTFNTSRPCIHLDNFLQITDINCEMKSLYLTFDSQTHASEAFTEWSSHSDLTILVGHERKCNEEEVGTFAISNMILNESKITIHTAESLKRSEIVTDWTLKVDHRELNIEKRNFFSDLKSGV
jgi:hypothetical protein